ncbi:MAG: DUF819 family protein [Bacteroidales bacterium]|nr:DUF819 family protein [Bacteroidales bacterium]
MISLTGLVLLYLFIPLLINYLCFKSAFLQKVGAVVLAYGFGLLIGNIGLIPESSHTMLELITNKSIILTNKYVQELFAAASITENDVRYFRVYHLQDLLTTLSIAIALPLLLFSLDVKRWFKVAGKTFLSLFLGLISVIIPILTGFFLFKDQIQDAWKVAGMMTGVYSGGTPNLASIQKALDVDTLTYILTHTYDLIIGVLFLLFVMTVGQKVLLRFLPAYKKTGIDLDEVEFNGGQLQSNSFFDAVKKKYLLPNLAAIGLTIVIVGVSAGIGMLFNQKSQMMITILGITTFSILASLIKRVNKIEKTFDYGMYFILIFSVVVASMADFRLFSTSHIQIFYWVALVYAGSLIIHVMLAALFKIDADNVIIVSTALTCSPPFVPVVAGALHNREIIISGITVGIIGYAIGNYLGVLLAQILYYL